MAGSPRKSRHWPTKMMTPIPAVKPMMTGAGMKRDDRPHPRNTQQDQDAPRHQRGELQT